jgi:hypothetical protein
MSVCHEWRMMRCRQRSRTRFVAKVKEQTNGLANGDMRQCSVCNEVKSIESFEI